MNRRLYLRLAWTGIRKNKQLYDPYLFAGSVMAAVFYIFHFLSLSEVVKSLPGREVLPVMFSAGAAAAGLFSVPFLFYTNSSLIRRRKKELGLYNILGMNKRNIFSILLRETLISYAIAVLTGIVVGVLFSKLAELILVNIMDRQVNYRIYVEWRSVLTALLVFGAIYLLILLNSLRQIRNQNPIELLHSDSAGERPPKSRWFPAILSLALILAAYGLSASLKAVEEFELSNLALIGILLIGGTFLFFICASVYLCRLLQGNKRYYYKTAHFVTVSTMSYRMKRNGASLAAICILVTLVLAACSFSVTFYAGSMDAIEKMYPYDMGVRMEIPAGYMEEEMASGACTDRYRSEMEKILENADVQDKDSIETYSLHSADMLAMLVDGRLDLGRDMRDAWFTPGISSFPGWEEGNEKIVWLHVLPLDTYNLLCRTSETLKADEAFVIADSFDYQAEDVILPDGGKLKIDKTAGKVPKIRDVRLKGEALTAHGCENVFLVVSEPYEALGGAAGRDLYVRANYMAYHWEYYVNMKASDEEQKDIYRQMEELAASQPEGRTPDLECFLKLEKGERYYALAGGLLFLALIMDFLFIVVTALIMYYKQISEGYEDQRRFAVMRKIGMTKKEIKRSIYSQMVMVFFLPLLVAGVHLIFTSNVVYLIQQMAVLDDRPLMIKCMTASSLVFAVIYAGVYALTSRTYYNIVNRAQ